jgi:hypothetical protein
MKRLSTSTSVNFLLASMQVFLYKRPTSASSASSLPIARASKPESKDLHHKLREPKEEDNFKG